MGSVLVVGAGAIGCWCAGRMALAGQDVTLWARPERAAALREGLRLETLPEADPAGTGHAVTVGKEHLTIVDDGADAPARPALAVFTTRAYQTADAAAMVHQAGVRPGAALTLQNGLGNAEALAAAFGPDVVVAGTTTHGVTWVAPHGVRHAGLGDTVVGPWTSAGAERAVDVSRRLAAAGIETEGVPDPRPALWLKVAVNAALNPPTAIHGVLNGALLDGGPLEAGLRGAAREVAAVATAEGVALDADAAEAAAVRVARRTAKNRSSMLQARLAGRPLETAAITGEVVRRGAAHGVPTPINAQHLEALRRLVHDD